MKLNFTHSQHSKAAIAHCDWVLASCANCNQLVIIGIASYQISDPIGLWKFLPSTDELRVCSKLHKHGVNSGCAIHWFVHREVTGAVS